MANINTQNSRSKKEKKADPLFNFGCKSEKETGSIQELIKEIKSEYQKESAEDITRETINSEIEFIEKITGFIIEKRNKNIPISALKIIKLLFFKRLERGNHLIRMISPAVDLANSYKKINSTMEFCTNTTISRDRDSSEIIKSILNEISKEISDETKNLHYKKLGDYEFHSTTEKILRHIEETNDKVNFILKNAPPYNNENMMHAHSALAKEVRNIKFKASEKNEHADLHESVFAYLTTLGLRHFIIHHREHFKKIKSNKKIESIENKAKNFFIKLNRELITDRGPYERLFSINNFKSLIYAYPIEICELVETATGHKSEKKELLANANRAIPLLMCYGFRSYDETNPDAPILSFIDIIAALCSFRHQQEIDLKYKPYWQGQQAQGDDPQRHYDKGWGIKAGKFNPEVKQEEIYQHQGVFQIYYDRFSEYQAAFMGKRDSYDAWMEFQLARLEAYEKIIKLGKIKDIWEAANMLDEYCIIQALKFKNSYT